MERGLCKQKYKNWLMGLWAVFILFLFGIFSSSAFAGEFKTTWKVGTTGYGNGDLSITTLRVSGIASYTIDWGDGSSPDTISTNNAILNHTYTTSGDYTVTISGSLTRFNDTTYPIHQDTIGKLTTVTDWGDNHWIDMTNMFSQANNLTSLPTTAPDLSGVSSMKSMFAWGKFI